MISKVPKPRGSLPANTVCPFFKPVTPFWRISSCCTKGLLPLLSQLLLSLCLWEVNTWGSIVHFLPTMYHPQIPLEGEKWNCRGDSMRLLFHTICRIFRLMLKNHMKIFALQISADGFWVNHRERMWSLKTVWSRAGCLASNINLNFCLFQASNFLELLDLNKNSRASDRWSSLEGHWGQIFSTAPEEHAKNHIPTCTPLPAHSAHYELQYYVYKDTGASNQREALECSYGQPVPSLDQGGMNIF